MDKKSWKKLIEKNCNEANTYQPYFDSVIDTLAQILETRDLIHEQYIAEGAKPTIFRNTERTEKQNVAKNPLLMLEQDLNTQALQYWKELGLTSKSWKSMSATATVTENSLEKVLRGLENEN